MNTTAAAPEISAETQRLLETDATQFDAELLEIFLTEASEVLDAIAASRTALAANPSDREALGTTRRGFHTLKGSGRMVGLADLGDLAWEVEKAHNRLLDEDRPVTAAVVAMIGVAESEFRKWVEALQRTRRVTLAPARLNAAVDAVMAELPSTGAPSPASPPPLPPRLAEVPAMRDTIEPADAIQHTTSAPVGTVTSPAVTSNSVGSLMGRSAATCVDSPADTARNRAHLQKHRTVASYWVGLMAVAQ